MTASQLKRFSAATSSNFVLRYAAMKHRSRSLNERHVIPGRERQFRIRRSASARERVRTKRKE
jgi:hypothetical protein